LISSITFKPGIDCRDMFHPVGVVFIP